MKAGRMVLVLCLLVVIAGAGWYLYTRGETRRHSIRSLGQLEAALAVGDVQQLPALLKLPAAIQDRTPAEQGEFLVKALRDEISAGGLQVLQKSAAFGPLTNLFPVEAQAWASQAGVKAEDCVAFKLERNGIRAEVVLAREVTYPNSDGKPADQFRIVRCNNVKQLATLSNP